MTDRNVASWFERRERANGESFYSLAENAPEWLKDAVREAHDGEMPDDWRYDTAHSIVSALDELDDPADDDFAHEAADSLTDVYTSNLIDWLTIDRLAYCDAARADGLVADDADIDRRMAIGQYECIRQMCDTLQAAYCEALECATCGGIRADDSCGDVCADCADGDDQ